MKQYMPLKPIKRGFKIWCRNDLATGYLFQFDFYIGKKENREGGLGENVVMQLSRSLIGANVRLYFDNFFTISSLIFKLKQDQICSCGTVRQKRKDMPKNLKKDKEMKRGELDRRQSEGIHLVKWMDTKGVIVLSTIDSSMPVVPVRRRLKGPKGKVTVEYPLKVKTYNNRTKDTDLMDQLKASYEVDPDTQKNFILENFLILWTSAI